MCMEGFRGVYGVLQGFARVEGASASVSEVNE